MGATRRRTFSVAGADIRVFAPEPVMDVVDRMLVHVPRQSREPERTLRLDARFQGDLWHVRGSAPKAKKTLSHASSLPEVAGAVVSSLLAEVAHHRGTTVWRGSTVERDGKALAIVGDDWESGVTLTAHLHTRGWRIVSGDYVLLDPVSFDVLPFRKLMHANSSCIPSFPTRYKRSIEASAWYARSDVIAFYAIDPLLVPQTPGWSDGGQLRALLRLEGYTAQHPALETAEDFVMNDGMRRADLVRKGVEVAMLVSNGFVETGDLIERWFATFVHKA